MWLQVQNFKFTEYTLCSWVVKDTTGTHQMLPWRNLCAWSVLCVVSVILESLHWLCPGVLWRVPRRQGVCLTFFSQKSYSCNQKHCCSEYQTSNQSVFQAALSHSHRAFTVKKIALAFKLQFTNWHSVSLSFLSCDKRHLGPAGTFHEEIFVREAFCAWWLGRVTTLVRPRSSVSYSTCKQSQATCFSQKTQLVWSWYCCNE